MQSAGSEMGEEIETAGFTRDDFLRFADRLIEETEIAGGLFVTDGFSQSGHTLGFEIECWILDHNYFPASINQHLLASLAWTIGRFGTSETPLIVCVDDDPSVAEAIKGLLKVGGDRAFIDHLHED